MLAHETFVETDDMTFGQVICTETEPAIGGEETEPAFSVSFPTSGIYVRHIRNTRVVASTTNAIFFNSGEVHQVSHPAGAGDVNIFASLSESIAETFLSPVSEQFPMWAVPIPASSHWVVRLLAADATAGYVGPLEVEETLINILGQLLRPDLSRPTQGSGRVALANDAQEYIAVNQSRNVSLRAVASAIGASPHHLSRVFKSVTGLTLSTYRTQLRLRSAIDRISNGADDLSAVAVETGFYDHSHMNRTMQQYLGMAPSHIRRHFNVAP
jgi:AraC-like DNA-binding protein